MQTQNNEKTKKNTSCKHKETDINTREGHQDINFYNYKTL